MPFLPFTGSYNLIVEVGIWYVSCIGTAISEEVAHTNDMLGAIWTIASNVDNKVKGLETIVCWLKQLFESYKVRMSLEMKVKEQKIRALQERMAHVNPMFIDLSEESDEEEVRICVEDFSPALDWG
ncbi:hypothetical protein BDM02DRAFT_3251710 [Thelephora ganbajun]|uniref:Uncharacterized protein n=1 Tax=Thelephora ganbajun TaxID=370292 RepID=A0ACB6YXM7_THEGA|nr:hypothetical protein BDM02DRAFT_3251710 [Thelephora ganbajun]